ncbi:MAG: 1,4-dihydroxy-2-naphthoyl-CoA synthase [Bifidobacteriaceae bacterium]|nr:1,4-dihydroxy-2-naphthoyl-CoA synthase [Bifidobacteriaceae bacterium]
MDLPACVSETFAPARWRTVAGFEDLADLTFHRGVDRSQPGAPRDLPVVRIAIDRPEVRNAFRSRTVDELIAVLSEVAQTPSVAAVLLTGNGPSPKDGQWAFSSGGDQRHRGRRGYEDGEGPASSAGRAGTGRLHVLEAQRIMRTMPQVVIAVVDGWAAGGGHSLAVVADLTLACRQHGRFKQTDADVASFDAGYGAGLLARQVGQKRARQIFFLAQTYSAEEAVAWGAANGLADHSEIEDAALEWAEIVAGKSPTSIRMLKLAFNLVDDGLAGQQLFAGEATRLAYGTGEAIEGRDAFLERRPPDWTPFRQQIL